MTMIILWNWIFSTCIGSFHLWNIVIYSHNSIRQKYFVTPSNVTYGVFLLQWFITCEMEYWSEFEYWLWISFFFLLRNWNWFAEFFQPKWNLKLSVLKATYPFSLSLSNLGKCIEKDFRLKYYRFASIISKITFFMEK